MRILIINGSHRKGNTDLITEKVIKALGSQNEVKELFLRHIEMKIPDGCEQFAESEICKNVDDQFSIEIEPGLREYDIYILATPVYSDAITPLLKIFWDRIVSWAHPDRMYLRGKKLTLIAHGMGGDSSSKHVVEWLKSVCKWEQAEYVKGMILKSGSRIGDFELAQDELDSFINNVQ